MISIGLPAIKPQFLREAIQSVIDQTFADFELIINNDRASPEIREIARTFGDPRIRYTEETHALDVVSNWNRVLSYATGEFFVLFSDDDRYHPEFLAEMHHLLTRYPACNIAHCRVRKIGEKGDLREVTAQCPEYESGLEFIFRRVNGEREQFAPEFLVRTEKLMAIGGFTALPLAWGSDDITWFRLALEGGVACSARALADWRQSQYQISRAGDVEKRLEAVSQYEALLFELIGQNVLADEVDKLLPGRITGLIPACTDRMKAHLVAMNALNVSFPGQTAFFLRNRRRHGLKIRWFLYSIYARMNQRKITETN